MSLQSGVKTLLRSASEVQTSICRHFLSSDRPRSFSVCTRSRRRHRRLLASSVDELLLQAARVFLLSGCVLTLVLEEDGSVVDAGRLRSLADDTPLMVLQRGETWTHRKILPNSRQLLRNRIVTLTFDLYKQHPKDFLCCLVVRADVCDTYSLTYDFRCSGIKHLLRWTLRCLTSITTLSGRLLLAVSSALQHVAGDEGDC